MIINERLAALRAEMAAADCKVYLIPTGDPHAGEYSPAHYNARQYFSGFVGENSVLVVTDEKSALWVDGRFFVQAEKQLLGTEIELMRMGEPGVPTTEVYCADNLGEGQTLGLCGLTATTSMVRKLEATVSKKGAVIKCLNLEDKVWVEGRPALPTPSAWILPTEFAGTSISEKLTSYRAKLTENDCTAALVSKLESVAWLLNLRAFDTNGMPFATAYCYVTMQSATLFTDLSLLSEEAKETLAQEGVTLAAYESIVDFIAQVSEPQTVLAESAGTNFAIMGAVDANSALSAKDIVDPILLMKGVKTEFEMKHTRNAHIKDGVAVVRFEIELEERLAAGETLYETDIVDIMHKHRSAQPDFIIESFPTIAAYGPNASMMHYQASKDPAYGTNSEILRKGFLLVDSGANFMDGTTDITRTFPVGPLTEDECNFYTWTLQSHIEMARAVFLDTCSGKMLDMIARQPLWSHLINYRCGTGHGVGYVGFVHEGPQSLSPRGEVVFTPGMTITNEPGVYETDLVGIRIENEMLCYAKETNQYGNFLAFETFTYAPIDTKAVKVALMHDEQIAWLNDFHKMVYDTLAPRLTEAECVWLKAKTAPLVK